MSKANILLAVFIVTNLFVFADEVAQPQHNSESSGPHHVYMGPDIFRSHYSHNYSFPHYDSRIESNTVFYGLRAGYEYVKPRSIYGSLEGAYAWGHTVTKVDGVRWWSQSRLFANAEGRIGYSFQPIQRFLLTPYVGIGGYHFGSNQWPKFDENWMYGVGGIRSVYAFGSHFDLGLNLKGMRAFFGNIHLLGKKHGFDRFWGYEVDLPLSWHFGKSSRWDFQLQPYYTKLNTRMNEYIVGGRLLAGYRF